MQERRQHARGIRVLQARKERGGGGAPRLNDRITESATKESREAKRKAKKAIQETNGKRQDEETKRTIKEKGSGTRRTTKGGKKRRERKNEIQEKGKRQGFPGGTVLIT